MVEERKLSAILFADIAGYTSMMQRNETHALRSLNRFKEIVEIDIPQHDGKIVQFFGDGCLIAFDSSSKAVTGALAVQQKFIREEIPVRIGMHLGDVLFKNNNAFGDGVNVASRIESMSVPGSILLSKSIRDQIKNKTEFNLKSLGSFEFKNVDEPIEVFAISNEGIVLPDPKKISGKLRHNPRRSARSKSVAALILLGLVIASVFMVTRLNPFGSSHETYIPKMAILDFINQGNSDYAYFASGIADELNSRLIGLQKIEVIARSSVLAYKDSDLSPQEIGRALDVDYVLEGKVEWSDQGQDQRSIRITPNLIKVSDNTSVWSGQLGREYDEVQSIQSDISNELLQKLDIALTQEERDYLQASLTDNPLAYDVYLKGMQIKPVSHGAEDDFRAAHKLFHQAMLLDSNFSMAWLELGTVYMDYYWFGYESHPSYLDSAWTRINKAAELDPDNPQVAIRKGDFYYRQRSYDQSLKFFSQALKSRPNDPRLLQYLAELWRRQGLFDQAIETMERGLSLDPYNHNTLTELSWTYIFVGNYDRALELQDRAKSVNPEADWNHLIRSLIHWSRGADGDLKIAHELLQNVPDPRSFYPAWFWLTQYWYEQDYEAAIRLANNLSVPAIELQHSWEPRELILGLANFHLDKTELARTNFTQAVTILEDEVSKNHSDFRMHMALGLAYAGLGKIEEAVKSGQTGLEILPLENDHLLGLDVLYGMMRIYALSGQYDHALDIMSKLLSVPCHIGGFFFTKNPEFAKLQENDRFDALIEKQNAMRKAFMKN